MRLDAGEVIWMTSRRIFLKAVTGGLLAVPLAVGAQQTRKVYRVGFVWDSPTVWPHALDAFRQGLRDLGWIEGQNIVIEYRWAEGRFERLPGLMEELVRLKVDLIVAPTSIYTGAAKRATSTIPIVFVSHADPIGSGHVSSLARPGANATGLTIIMSETMAKSLELLKATIPGLTRVAVIWDPRHALTRTGLEGRRGRWPDARHRASTAGGAQRGGLRRYLLGHRPRRRRRGPGSFDAAVHG
jgi:putative ABC transport system substrate-binding protein